MNKNLLIVIMSVFAFWALVRGIISLCNANIEQNIMTSMKESKLGEENCESWREASYMMRYSDKKYGFDFSYSSDYYERDCKGGIAFVRKDDKYYMTIGVKPCLSKETLSTWQFYDTVGIEKIVYDFGEKKETIRNVFKKNGHIYVQYIFLHGKYDYCITMFQPEEKENEPDKLLTEREFIESSEQMLTNFRLRK